MFKYHTTHMCIIMWWLPMCPTFFHTLSPQAACGILTVTCNSPCYTGSISVFNPKSYCRLYYRIRSSKSRIQVVVASGLYPLSGCCVCTEPKWNSSLSAVEWLTLKLLHLHSRQLDPGGGPHMAFKFESERPWRFWEILNTKCSGKKFYMCIPLPFLHIKATKSLNLSHLPESGVQTCH